MNKRALFISLSCCATLVGVSAGLLLQANGPLFAFAAEDCDGFHYAEVKPTFDTAGHREYWICCKHGEVSLTQPEDGHYVDQTDDKMIGGAPAAGHDAYLPALNETDYTRKATKYTKNSGQGYKETWTYKGYEVLSTEYDFGCISVLDKTYSPEYFNKTFEGIEVSVDKTKATMTINVTKEGGYTFDGACITLPSCAKNTVTITGEPLTINASNGTTSDGLSFWCSTLPSYMCTAVIDTDVTVACAGSSTKNAVYESILTINQGASLKASGFNTGLSMRYSPITVNGTLVVKGNNAAAVNSSSSNQRKINYAADLDLYLDKVLSQAGGGTLVIDKSETTSYKELAIIPTGADINNY